MQTTALTGIAELLSVAIHVTKTNTPLHIDTGMNLLPISSLPLSVNSITCHWNPNKMIDLRPLSLKCHLLCHQSQALTQVVFSATLVLPTLNKSKQMINASFHLHYMCVHVCMHVQLLGGVVCIKWNMLTHNRFGCALISQALTRVVFSATLVLPTLKKSKQMINASYHLHYMCVHVCTCTGERGNASFDSTGTFAKMRLVKCAGPRSCCTYRGGTRLWIYWLDTQTSGPTTNKEQTPF